MRRLYVSSNHPVGVHATPPTDLSRPQPRSPTSRLPAPVTRITYRLHRPRPPPRQQYPNSNSGSSSDRQKHPPPRGGSSHPRNLYYLNGLHLRRKNELELGVGVGALRRSSDGVITAAAGCGCASEELEDRCHRRSSLMMKIGNANINANLSGLGIGGTRIGGVGVGTGLMLDENDRKFKFEDGNSSGSASSGLVRLPPLKKRTVMRVADPKEERRQRLRVRVIGKGKKKMRKCRKGGRRRRRKKTKRRRNWVRGRLRDRRNPRNSRSLVVPDSGCGMNACRLLRWDRQNENDIAALTESGRGTTNELIHPSATTFLVPLRVTIPPAARQINLGGCGLPPVDPERVFLSNLVRVLSSIWEMSRMLPSERECAREAQEADFVLEQLQVERLRIQHSVVPLSGADDERHIPGDSHTNELVVVVAENEDEGGGRSRLERSNRDQPATLRLRAMLRDLNLINVALKNSSPNSAAQIEMRRFRKSVGGSGSRCSARELSIRRFVLNNLRVGLIYEHLNLHRAAIKAYEKILLVAQRTGVVASFHSAVLNFIGCCFMVLFLKARFCDPDEGSDLRQKQDPEIRKKLLQSHWEMGMYFHKKHFEVADADGRGISLTNQAILHLFSVDLEGVTPTEGVTAAEELLHEALQTSNNPIVKIVALSNLVLCEILLSRYSCADRILRSVFVTVDNKEDDNIEEERCAHRCICEILLGQTRALLGDLNGAVSRFKIAVETITATKPFGPLLHLARTSFAKAKVDNEMRNHARNILRKLQARVGK